VTASMGITVVPGGTRHALIDILQEADLALYTAKKNGRNRVEVFSSLARHMGTS
jgi:GGDEF domain-containing protein